MEVPKRIRQRRLGGGRRELSDVDRRSFVLTAVIHMLDSGEFRWQHG